MQLPQTNAAFEVRVRYGRYVARRLKQAGLTSLAGDVAQSTAELKTKGRAFEDKDEAAQDALADRDGADDGLDLTTQTARAGLAGRAADATKRAPYTAIFPDGIGYYTASPLGEQTRRYGELQKRLELLPANDEVRTVAVANIAEGLKSYEAGQKAVTDARIESNLARTALSQATEAWVRQLERAYGALVQELGRQRAETFFPRMNHGNGHSEGPAADAKPA